MDRKLYIVLVASLILGAGFYGLLQLDVSEGVEVIQCTNQSTTCNTQVITEYRTGCDSYAAWDSLSSLDCNKTESGIEEISLVTDAANFVKAPVGRQDYSVEVLNQTGDNPWDLEFLPSGDRLWTNKGGSLRLYDGNSVEKIDELDVVSDSEMGLLGLAIDPNFEENRYIYLYYTGNKTDRKVGKLNKTLYKNYVARFKLTQEGLEDRKRLIELPGSEYHSGGRLEFGPDGKLYVTTGEAAMLYKASDRSNLAGKILRLNSDGSIPDDNPFNDSPVYSMGHRNPQGIAWNPETGNLYNSEHGNWRHDEVNRVIPGEKYGWSGYQCDEKRDGLFGEFSDRLDQEPEDYYENTPPVHCFEEWTMAPSGMTFVNDTESRWHGDLFLAGLRGKHIHRFEFENGEIVRNEIFYNSRDEPGIGLRMREVEYREGSLYAISDTKGMVRITPD